MIAPTTNTKFGFKIFSPKLMSLRTMIGMLILINMAMAAQEGRSPSRETIRTESSDAVEENRVANQTHTWTLVTQKVGYRVFGRSKDSSLSTIKISYNADGKRQYRLVSMFKGTNKRFYFGTDRQRKLKGQKNAFLNLTEADLDRVNNCVLLRIRSSAQLGRICNRRIFYLEQDGPAFIRFLLDQGRIQIPVENPEEWFTRHTVGDARGEHTIGYAVTLMKDDWKNKTASNFVTNWAMQQTSQLRVYMENHTTVKHFVIAEKMGNVKFTIKKISTYDEENNRVLLTVRADESILEQKFRTPTGPANRWLYLGQNTDSKKFLLFLMEMYHNQLTGIETQKFSKATAASIPTIFDELVQNDAGVQIVRDYIRERNNTENARKLGRIYGLNNIMQAGVEGESDSQMMQNRRRSNCWELHLTGVKCLTCAEPKAQ